MREWGARLKTLWKKRSIKEQILVSMLMCSVVTALALGGITFVFSKKTMERNYQLSHQYNLDVSGRIIDIHLRTIIDSSRTLLNHQGFKNIILGETLRSTYFTSSSDVALNHILGDIGEQSKYIQSIAVISSRGNIHFYSKLSTQSGKMMQYHRERRILEMDWVPVALKAQGKEVFFGRNLLFDDNNETLSMVKTLKNTEDGQDMGYVIFNIKKSLFSTAFGKNDEGYVTNRYMIIDNNGDTSAGKEGGDLVYFHGGAEVKQEVMENYTEQKKGTYLFSEVHNPTSSWEIVNVISKGELSRDSNYIGWITITVCMVMLLVCCLIASGTAKIITRPLELLKKNISTVGTGKFQVEEEYDESEIGRIGNQFKDMVNNNLDLHEKLLHSEIREKEAELLLLQSQINPHFLYNTLDSLYFMAIIERADDIAEMVLALSDTFKLSLNKGEKLIRVKDEIEKVKAYMKLQNMRYHNRFQLQIEIDSCLMDCRILTFILQPLVENAVYHGLEPKVGNECFIRLTGVEAGDGQRMELHIRDNGVGIEDLSLLEEGYGVKNIRERIALFYGGHGEIQFDSKPGWGTEVTLILPSDAQQGEV